MVPAVSICIPAYEQPDFLARAIESVYAQDFQDFEIIVTDDSKTDQVRELTIRWADDSRFIYHRNETRLGSPENWNAAMNLARADLIKILHHDDWFARSDSLSRFVAAMKSNLDASIAFSAANACEDDGSLIFVHQPGVEQVEAFVRRPLSLQFANFIGAPSATIFRKIPGFQFDTQLRWVVDIDAYLRIAGPNPRCTFIPDPLVSVSSNGAHQVTRHFAENRISRAEEHLYLYAKHQPIRAEERRSGIAFLWRLLQGYSHAELDALSQKRARAPQTLEELIVLSSLKTKSRFSNLVSKLRNRLGSAPQPHDTAHTSYSQCGEDMIVDFLFAWLGLKNISYLDIGAHHPTWLSNTYHFYRRGNRGVLIEPDEDLCHGLREKRPEDQVLNIAVNVSGDDEVNMYVMTSRTLNTLDKSQAEALDAGGRERIEAIRKVRRTGINEILAQQFGTGKPNFVSLDIEGLDFDILQAWDYGRFRPEVFCVETLTYTQDNTEQKINDIIDLMISKGYKVYADTYVNTIFVCKDAWAKRPV